MNKQTKHRILGTLVAVALTFLSLPFIQHSSDIESPLTLVKAPPFPDLEDISAIAADNVPLQTPPIQHIMARAITTTIKHDAPPHHIVKQAAMLPAKSNLHKAPTTNTPIITDNGLFNIKTKIWIIQLASFHSKQNAIQLINRLRVKGYPAFLQQLQTAQGSVRHRVFVGPKLEHEAARSLANNIEAEYHLKGMIISYQPMTLS